MSDSITLALGQSYTRTTPGLVMLDGAGDNVIDIIHGTLIHTRFQTGGNTITLGDDTASLDLDNGSGIIPYVADTITGGTGSVGMSTNSVTTNFIATSNDPYNDLGLFLNHSVFNFTAQAGVNTAIDVIGGDNIINLYGTNSLVFNLQDVNAKNNIVNAFGSSTISGGSSFSLNGDDVLNSNANDTVFGGAGNSLINIPATIDDLVVMGAGNATITGSDMMGSGAVSVVGAATVFGGAGSLNYIGGSGIFVLGSGNSSIGGGSAGAVQIAFGGRGTISYDGGAEKSYVIASTGSITVQAGSGGGWIAGGSNGDNIIDATGIGTILEGGGDGDVLTGDQAGWTYFLAGAGNETLTGGNISGTNFDFLGSGSELVNLGRGGALLQTGTGTATINGGGGIDQVWQNAGGATLFDPGNGGSLSITGFRIGIDHLGLAGQSITGGALKGGSTVLSFSSGASVTLVGQDATHAANLFG